MASVHTTYSFNTEIAPVSVHHDENENDDRDGLFLSSGSHTTTNGSSNSSGNSPRRWYRMSSNTIFMSILIVVLGINIALIQHNKSNSRHDSTASSLPQTVSTKLYNALIPPWKPLPSSDTIMTTIAFGSCASQNMPQSFWDTIMLSSTNETSQQNTSSFHPRPDLFIYTGDNVYGDCSSDACTELRMAYYNLSRHPSIQGIASQIPIIATLDDHDYGMNNCHAHNPYKDTAKELFQEFFKYLCQFP